MFLSADTKVESYQNEAVKSVRTDLDEWNINLWRQYPYLYVYQGETNYNSIFEDDPEAFVLVATRNGKMLGFLQANPLDSSFLDKDHYTPYTQLDKIRKNGFDPSKILYVSCFLMTAAERSNVEAINLLLDRAIEEAKKLGKTQICYMELVEDEKHPLRPTPYVPLEPWRDLGKELRSMDVVMEMDWPTLQPDGNVKEEMHQMAFYVMDIK